MIEHNFYTAGRNVIRQALGVGENERPSDWRAGILALAGLCATQMEIEGVEIDAWRILAWLDDGSISISDEDRALVGNIDEDIVEETLIWCRKYWPATERAAVSMWLQSDQAA